MVLLYTHLAHAQPNLVWISLDTTRADALSCYGMPPVPIYDTASDTPRTPVLDALASRGLRFQRFYAQSPSTLASHATMFTGQGPHATHVVRNGFPLRSDLPTLAERLQQAGYATRAVIGAAALEKGMGIERGFQVYDDDSPSLRGLMYQSPAPEVVARALKQAETRPAQPLFLFAHFFDAHAPYEPPEPWLSRYLPPGYTGQYADPERKVRPLVGVPPTLDHAAVDGRYLGELGALDHQLGVLLDGLDALGVLDDALVVVVGDHGEALSDDPVYAWTHGNNVADGVMRVPLLLEAHGSVVLGRGVVERTAAMEQLAATVEGLLGLEPTLGPGFPELVRPGPVNDVEGWPEHPTRTVFMEATRPRIHESAEAWNNLPLSRRVIVGPYEHNSYPAMETVEPGPLSPLLGDLLQIWDKSVPAHQEAAMPEHTVRALQALGYLED